MNEKIFLDAKELELSQLNYHLDIAYNSLQAYEQELTATMPVDAAEKIHTLISQKEMEIDDLENRIEHTHGYNFQDLKEDDAFDRWKYSR